MKHALFALCIVWTGCGSAKPITPTTTNTDPEPMTEQPAPAKVKAELLAAEMAAYEKAKPVFEKYCSKCHSKDGSNQSVGKREHFDMTTYPFGGHHAMDVHNEIRMVLGLTGKKPTMPADKKGAVTGAELERIKAWADAFDASYKGGAHEGHDQPGGGHKH